MAAKKKTALSMAEVQAFEVYDRLLKAEEGARRASANLAFLVPEDPNSPFRALMEEACTLEHKLEDLRREAGLRIVKLAEAGGPR